MDNLQDIYSAVTDDLNARADWESRQKLWYEMRHNGLRRKNKPWPMAADLHYPLADSIINKLKPFYFQQIYASDLIAQFSPWQQQSEAMTTATMMWFDYKLRQASNLETEIQTCIDLMLMSGLCLLKVTWDVDRNRLRFDACNPLYVIAPPWTQDLQETTRLVHVLPMSVDAYRTRSEYQQNENFVESITGRGADQSQRLAFEQSKDIREGLNTSSREDEIIVWEVYERKNGRWLLHTFSPQNLEEPIKGTVELPYDHGQLPFVPFVTEIKDKGFYSPRGIPEQVAPFEASLCKLWNEKHDTMTIYNRPMFQAAQELPNAINLKFQPGQILPFGIAPISMPSPPISFDQEMEHLSAVAEELIAIPNFGLGSPQNVKSSRTATEINALGGLMGQNVDMRARLFRLGLGQLYEQCWSLLRQYDYENLNFYHASETGEVSPEAIANDYVIHPSGSADGVNRPMMLQKAVARMQMFSGNQYVNQEELVRSVLEIDDPRLIGKLLQDPQERAEAAAQSQAEQQSEESLLMESGFPVTVKPQDDDAIHLQMILNRLEDLGKSERPLNVVTRKRYLDHIAAHLQKLQTVNPKLAIFWRIKLEQAEEQEFQKAKALMAAVHAQRANKNASSNKPVLTGATNG